MSEPECGGRRNGRAPTSGENCPIGMPGNVGLIAGLSTPPDSDSVTSASRYVYEAMTRTERATAASNVVSTPCALNDCELT